MTRCHNRRELSTFTTIKEATHAGFRARKPWEYGGEEISLKGRTLARTPPQ
jgi:hypothetical protein